MTSPFAILKMMHFKKGPWCDVMDGLYWRFIDKNKKFFMFKLHPITYIMVIAFITSFILQSKGNENWALPFIGGWIFIPVTWIYFKFQPQTWEEMEDYEKVVFRGITI